MNDIEYTKDNGEAAEHDGGPHTQQSHQEREVSLFSDLATAATFVLRCAHEQPIVYVCVRHGQALVV